ncbi:MAG: amino acid permease [Candidatus Eremiobacteraeota bacterium]|nr:amino acid permease [Candidatus Eremiobacteraeota bacterium]
MPRPGALKQLVACQPLGWTAPASSGPALRRVLGWPALTAIGLGTMLGGIFPTIGAGAHAAGPGVILAYVLSGLVSLCVALCYAEFASMVPVAGSAYTYAYATLGELVAWIIGWDLILEYGLSLAPTASSLSDYFQHMLANVGIVLPAWAQTANLHGPQLQIDLFASIVTLAIALLVAVGIRESASVNGALVVLQILAMLVFIVAVAHAIHPANLQPFAPFGYHGVLASTALVFFAYIGFDTVTVASEEAKSPERNVPIGIIVALTLGGILYVALTLCTVGVLRFDRLSDGAAMLDALGSVTKSHALYWIVALGGLAGNTTVMLTSLLGQVRIFYVMARDRMLPPSVAHIHHVFRTPARMTMITGAIVAIFAAVLPLTELLTLVNIGTLAAFAIVCAGVLVLRVVNPSAQRPFRAPLLPFFSIAGAVSCCYLVTGLQVATWIRYAIWFGVGIVVYALYGFRNSRLRVELIEP